MLIFVPIGCKATVKAEVKSIDLDEKSMLGTGRICSFQQEFITSMDQYSGF
jgi:hypothetical protein